MPPVESNKKGVKEGTGLKIFTQNLLLNRFSVLLAQIKTGNNLYRLKMKSEKCYKFCISIIKLSRNFAII